MKQLVAEIASYLQASAIGTVGKSIFKYGLPSTPVECLAIIPTGGVADVLSELNYQILVRGTNIQSTSSRANDVFVALNEKWDILSSVKGYHRASHPVGAYYYDENNYVLFTLNFVFRGVGRNLGI